MAFTEEEIKQNAAFWYVNILHADRDLAEKLASMLPEREINLFDSRDGPPNHELISRAGSLIRLVPRKGLGAEWSMKELFARWSFYKRGCDVIWTVHVADDKTGAVDDLAGLAGMIRDGDWWYLMDAGKTWSVGKRSERILPKTIEVGSGDLSLHGIRSLEARRDILFALNEMHGMNSDDDNQSELPREAAHRVSMTVPVVAEVIGVDDLGNLLISSFRSNGIRYVPEKTE